MAVGFFVFCKAELCLQKRRLKRKQNKHEVFLWL